LNSSLSLHKAVLDLLASARLPLAALLTHSFGLILRGRSYYPVVGLTAVMIASPRNLKTGLTRRSGYFRKVGSPPPILSCPTDVVLLPRSHLIANRAVRG